MFVSTDLAARIDRAEARLSRSFGQAVLARGMQVDAFVEQIADGVAVYAGPSSPMNKMIGVGFGTLPADDRLRVVEERFRTRGAPLQAEVSTLADSAFAANLTRRGYILQGFENVSGRTITSHDAGGDRSDVIEVALTDDADLARWLDVMITGFHHPDLQGVQAEPMPGRETLERALGDIFDVPGVRRYAARVDGQLAGAATLRFDEGLAQLCGAATLPAFRRRGIQTALLHRRLADAFHGGCDLALMTTQPGSKSEENGRRQGFQLLYSRALLVKHASTIS
jgi:ribosomal protein S18 acetylase RimI-like enzyme